MAVGDPLDAVEFIELMQRMKKRMDEGKAQGMTPDEAYLYSATAWQEFYQEKSKKNETAV